MNRKWVSAVVFLAAAVVLLPIRAEAQLQNNTPTGGSKVDLRRCNGGSNDGDLCNEDAVCAGGGTCDPYNVVHLTINFRESNGAGGFNGFTPSAAQRVVIESGFQDVNDVLYDTTDGQMVLGTIGMIPDNKAPNAVIQYTVGTCNANGETCVHSGDCAGTDLCDTANSRCMANPGVFCVSDAGCNTLSDTCDEGGASAGTGGWGRGGQISCGPSCLTDPQALVHEMMHLMTGVRDEYEGEVDNGIDDDFDQGTGNPDSGTDECHERIGHKCVGGTNDGRDCVTGNDPVECPGGGVCEYLGYHRCFGGPNDGDPCNPGVNCGTGVCQDISCQPLGGADTIMACCGGLQTNELCTAANHDPDFDTEQSQCNSNKSGWEMLSDNWPDVILAPATPIAGPAPAPNTVNFVQPNVIDRFVAIVDRSGSMGTNGRMGMAQDALNDFVDLLSDGAEFGIVTFSGSADGAASDDDSEKIYPTVPGLATVGATRGTEHGIVNGIAVDTNGYTRIGAGVQTALDAFTEASGSVTMGSSILLLTDGLNNRPSDDPDADLFGALANVQNAGLQLFVTCIDEARTNTQCAEIADRSSGRFVDSAAAPNLYDAFVDYLAQAEGNGISTSQINLPIMDGTTTEIIPVQVDEGASEARFVVSWKNDGSDLDIFARDPNGDIYNPLARINGYKGEFYKIPNPMPGTWELLVSASAAGDDETYSVRTLIKNQSIHTSAQLAKSLVNWTETAGFELSALPGAGLPVTGCDVSALVEKPDGTTETFDIDEDNGCTKEGVHSTIFRNVTAGAGIYTFTISINCEPGQAHRLVQTERGMSMPPIPEDIGSGFSRVVRFSGILDGDVPDDLPPVAEICYDVSAQCGGETTPVSLNGTCSYDPEGTALTFAWASDTGTFDSNTMATPTGNFALGTHSVSLVVEDEGGNQSVPNTATVKIIDTIAPEIEQPEDVTVSLCDPSSDDVVIDVPKATDICTPPTVTGWVIAMNGVALDTPDEVIDGVVSLNYGVYTIKWTASDGIHEVSVTQQVSVLPSVYGTELVDIRDRATVDSLIVSGGAVISHGVEATMEGIIADGDVDLRDRSIVNGDVIASGVILEGNNLSISGDLLPGTSVTLPDQLTGTSVSFALSGLQNIDLQPDQTLVLNPGTYGDVFVKSRARLILSDGVYHFGRLQIEPQAIVDMTACTETMHIVVDSRLILRGVVQNPDVLIQLYYQGDDMVVLETPFSGAVIAPDASVNLEAAGGNNTFAGQVFANDIVMRPDVEFECEVNYGI